MAERALIFGLSPDIRDAFARVFARYTTVERVLLFGSRAKGTFKDGSDIDLAVFAPRMSDRQFSRLWNDIDDLPIVFKIDLLHWDRLSNERLKDKILDEGQPFFAIAHLTTDNRMDTNRQDLYPITEPFATHELVVDNGHRLYVEECGRPDGIPAIFLHGGPGAGCEAAHRGFFDPERYRAVLFDQRGCGRSTPHASLTANTTWDLVADLERIREQLGIERWLVFGGSWGSTLALAYAETHPERVAALVARGIFLCRDAEIRWFYQEGANWIFPDYWEEYLAPIPADERGDLLAAYHRRLAGADEVARMAAAKAWSVWEGRTATLLGNPGIQAHFADPHVALSLARIECHYFVHRAFLEPDQLLRNAHRLAPIPGVIVQGRYDAICPMRSAWDLHQAWPTADFQVIADAGHSAFEPGIRQALVAATDRFAHELG